MLSKVEQFTQGHRESPQWSWDLNLKAPWRWEQKHSHLCSPNISHGAWHAAETLSIYGELMNISTVAAIYSPKSTSFPSRTYS